MNYLNSYCKMYKLLIYMCCIVSCYIIVINTTIIFNVYFLPFAKRRLFGAHTMFPIEIGEIPPE